MKANNLLFLVGFLTPVAFALAADAAPSPGEAGELTEVLTGVGLFLLSETVFRGMRTKKALSWLWLVNRVAEAVAVIATHVARYTRSLAELGDKKLPQRIRKPKAKPEPQP